MSQNIVDVWDGVQNTNSWVHDGNVERSAVDIVELASSVAGYSAGAQAAADAASGYADTASAAVASIGTAATDAVQAVQDEGTAQISSLVAAGGVQTGLLGSAGAVQIADIVTSGGIVTSAVASEGATQIAAVTSAGGAQVALVSAAGTSATGDLAAVTAAQSAALVSAGGYQSGLIATAGSAQITAVQAEGGTQIAAVQLAASAQVNSATVAAMSAGAAASTAQAAASAASGYAVSAGSFATVTSGYMVSAGGYATSAGSAADAASGYALTASSYMTSAGGYASAASDNADAAAASAASIASEVEQIAENTTDIAVNAKDIANIKSLLNGVIYQEQTDSAEAYSKTVPAGAQPWASVESIGGKTLVWNSWFDQIAGINNLAQRGITLVDNEDGSATFSGTCTENYNNALNFRRAGSTEGAKQGEKWFVRLRGNPGIKFGMSGAGGSTYTTTEYKIQTIVTATTNIGIGCTYTSGETYSGTVWPCIINLTKMFGAGNEPTDADAVNAMFPADYYAADTGILKSAGVTSIVSKDSDAVTLDSYTIPAEVQALPGYGWSAGTANNYIDFERKVYVQAVGSRAYAAGDESDSTVTTDKTTTCYPLGTPVETDISALLSDDNLIEVEPGGSVSFPNALGDDYKINIPSAVTYDIKLEDAING